MIVLCCRARGRVGVGLANDDEECTVGVRGAGDKPLVPVDDDSDRPSRRMLVLRLVASEEATLYSVMAKAERISPCSSGSSQRSRCSLIGVMLQRNHVGYIGRLTIEYQAGAVKASNLFSKRSEFEVGKSSAGFIVSQIRQGQVPQTLGLGQRA